MAKISVTWKKSTIGYSQKQRRIIESLGLRKLNHTVVHEASPSIIGMLNKVGHLVEVREGE
jgi:large subunit ribosomal protein L30